MRISRTAALGLFGYLVHAYQGEASEVDGLGASGERGGRGGRRPAERAIGSLPVSSTQKLGASSKSEPGARGRADPARTWPITSSLATSVAGLAAQCKAKDNAVGAAEVERAVREVVELLDEHLHRQGSDGHTSASSVSVDSGGFRAVISVPRGVLTAEMLVDGMRAAVRSLRNRHLKRVKPFYQKA